MYENSNQEVIQELSREQFHSHKVRNNIAILAIALTTILIASILTAGFSFLTTMHEATQQAPGPGADGALIGTKEQYEQIKKLEQVERVDFVQKCSTVSLHNDIFAGTQVELLAPDQSFYSGNMVKLKNGALPQTGNELLLSDTLAKRLNLQETVGQQLTLQVVVLKNGHETEQDIQMTICGFYQNPLAGISDVYEEIYTGTEFIGNYNPELSKNQNYIYIKLNNLNPLLLNSDIYDKLLDINELVKADAVQTKHTMEFTMALILLVPILFFVLLIMASGYFLINNVFYISIVSDIQWFGMMKTIGATAKQLTIILKKQVHLLAFFGIAIGSVIGYVVGSFIAPGVMQMTNYGIYYKQANIISVLLFTVIFAWCTICISTAKPLRTASGISPIEASKYVPAHKKNWHTVLSFALSGIVFLVVCNITLGFQVEVMVERHNQEDCNIFHAASFWDLEEPYQPLSEEFIQAIKGFPFIEDIIYIYTARTKPDYYETNLGRMYEESNAELKLDGKLKEELDALMDTKLVNKKYNQVNMSERKNIKLVVTGIPARHLLKETSYLQLKEGTVDEKKFATGDYILYRNVDYLSVTNGVVDEDKLIHAQDQLELTFYDDKTDEYKQKTVTVMAIIKSGDPYGTGDINYSNIVIPDTLFQEIYSAHKEMVTGIQIKTKGEMTAEQLTDITNLVQKEHNVQIKINSKYRDRHYYLNQKQSLLIIGFFLAGLLGIIGISNIVNTVTSDIFSRKSELATMQSIGMTARQLWHLLFLDSLRPCLLSFILMIPAGGYMSAFLAGNTSFTGFNIDIFIRSLLLIFLIIVTLCALIATAMTKILNKKSVVERLRDSE